MKSKLVSLFSLLLILTMVLPAFQVNNALAQGGDGEAASLVMAEVEGYIQYIGEDFIVVDGFVVYPNGGFEISTVAVDEYVFIMGTLNEDGSVKAISLEYVAPPEDNGEEDDEITIVGLVEVLNEDVIIIGGWIIAPAGVFNPSTLSIGDLVILTGLELNDTTVQASSFSILLFVDDECTEDTDGDGDIDDDDCVDDDDDDTECTEDTDGDGDIDDDDCVDDVPECTEDTDGDGDIDDDDCVDDTECTEDTDGDGDIDDDDCVDDDEVEDQRGVCTNLNPVGQSLATQYSVSEETILEWRCERFGYGEISRALSYAEQYDLDVEDILDMRRSGMGWGKIRKELKADEDSVKFSNDRDNRGKGKNKNKNKNKKNKK